MNPDRRRKQSLRDAVLDPRPVGGLASISPVAGLARRSLGFFDVMAQSVAAVAPSGAATTLPLLVFAATGDLAVVAYAAATLVVLTVASSINVFTRRMAAAGSLYSFVGQSFNAKAALLTGAGMIIGYGFVSMFALYAAAHYLAIAASGMLAGQIAGFGALAPVILVVLGAAYLAVLLGGLRLSARFTLLTEVISVAAIVVFAVALFALLPAAPAIATPVAAAADVDPPALLIGIALSLTSFVGFESSAALSVEAKRPFASVPRALAWTVVASGILFVLTSAALVTGFSRLGLDLSSSDSPVNDLAEALRMPWAGYALDVIIGMSFFAAAVASTTALVRVLFSLAREARIPAGFGRTSRRRHAPIVAILAVAPILLAVPLALAILPLSDWDVMRTLLTCATGGYVLGYVIVCFAAPVFLHRIGELTVAPIVLALSGGTLVAASFVVYIADLITDPVPIAALVLVGSLLGVTTLLFVTDRRRRRVYGAWAYDVPTAADVLGGAENAVGAKEQ